MRISPEMPLKCLRSFNFNSKKLKSSRSVASLPRLHFPSIIWTFRPRKIPAYGLVLKVVSTAWKYRYNQSFWKCVAPPTFKIYLFKTLPLQCSIILADRNQQSQLPELKNTVVNWEEGDWGIYPTTFREGGWSVQIYPNFSIKKSIFVFIQ